MSLSNVVFALLSSILRAATLVISYFIAYRISVFSFATSARIIRNRVVLGKIKGHWAIITGPTEGIGLSIARAFAEEGVNVVLVGRNPEKLEKVKGELAKKVDVRVVVADFSNTVNFGKKLAPLLKEGLDVRVLVNNVGVNNFKPTTFMENEMTDAIIQINVTNTLEMTREVVSMFFSDGIYTRYVLNVGSMLGFIPSPYHQVYSGSKAFLCAWSEALHYELKPMSVHVELLMTGLVCTRLSGVKRSGLFSPSAATYGKCCVRRFGSAPITYPYGPHEIEGLLVDLLPRWLVASAVMRHQAAVKEVLRRKEEDAKTK